MAPNAFLVDSFLPQTEKCGAERVKRHVLWRHKPFPLPSILGNKTKTQGQMPPKHNHL